MLDALLRKYKIDRNDYFGQLIKVGQDVVGAVTIEEINMKRCPITYEIITGPRKLFDNEDYDCFPSIKRS